MIALDTNVLLRFGLNDNEELSAIASDLIENNFCFVPLIAVAESGFVLTSFYQVIRSDVVTFMTGLLQAPNLQFEHELRLPIAIRAYEAGMDWFDSLLWCATPPTTTLATFDKKFKTAAARQKLTQPVVQSHLPA